MDLGREESELQEWLFADLKASNLKDNADVAPSPSSDLFVIDKLPSRSEDESLNDAAVPSMVTTKRCVWRDDEEENLQVDLLAQTRTKKLRKNLDEELLSGKEFEVRLRKQFESLYPKPLWLEKKDENSDDLFASTGNLIKKSQKIISPDKLLVTRVKDANQMGYSKSVISSVQFHPKAPVLLTGGLDKTLRIFQVDGKENTKIQSVYFKDLPIRCSKFTSDGREVILTGRRKHFYTMDIEKGTTSRIFGIRGRDEEHSFEKFFVSPCNKYLVFPGKYGHISLLSKNTKNWIADLKMNSEVKDIGFSGDGQYMYSFGDDGAIFSWDLGMRKCVSQFNDQGFIGGGSLAVSGDNKYLATGSSSGIVNLYGVEDCRSSSNPEPQKIIDNLVTPISALSFNHDAQILAIASKVKKDSFRLFHVPTKRVFSNWPTANTPLGYVNCMDFSPNGGYIAMGNDKGKTFVFEHGFSYPIRTFGGGTLDSGIDVIKKDNAKKEALIFINI